MLWTDMDTYHFRFNNSKKTLTILFWFFTTLLTITVSITTIALLPDPRPLFPAWLLLIFLPLTFTAIYRLFKAASARQSTETISLSKEGFTSSCFGSVLFSEIRSIRVPAREIALLGGRQYDYYKQTDADFPTLIFAITIDNGKTLKWVLGEWGSLYNSKEDFSIFFNFLTALTDQLYQIYRANEPYNSYLKILDEKGFWEKGG